MIDLNNRPGGPNLIVTAKTAHKVHFLDAATLTMRRPSTCRARPMSSRSRPTAAPPMARSMATACSPRASIPTGASGHRPAVEDAHAHHRSRRGLCAAWRDDGRAGTLWSSGELGNAVLAIDPETERCSRSMSVRPRIGSR